ncbi:Hypothetical protein PBC10988_29420 [Planctomycetales bacterium 10988]|nr:Hypothetical protein PBC10988_29420 [Planctomycetales bacterium 10988]
MTEPLQLMQFNPEWAQQYEQAKSVLLHACEGYVNHYEHIGSTAIEGLSALPVIDLMAGVEDLNHVEKAMEYIEGSNYLPIENQYEKNVVYFFRKPRHGKLENTLRIVKLDSPEWNNTIRFRNWLQQHPEDAQRFATVKRKLLTYYQHQPDAYQQGKIPFFRHIEDQAKASEENVSD